jgi:hypothetical protein
MLWVMLVQHYGSDLTMKRILAVAALAVSLLGFGGATASADTTTAQPPSPVLTSTWE